MMVVVNCLLGTVLKAVGDLASSSSWGAVILDLGSLSAESKKRFGSFLVSLVYHVIRQALLILHKVPSVLVKTTDLSNVCISENEREM